MNSEHEYDPDSSSLSTEVWAALWRQVLMKTLMIVAMAATGHGGR